jgi:hypothetical protein
MLSVVKLMAMCPQDSPDQEAHLIGKKKLPCYHFLCVCVCVCVQLYGIRRLRVGTALLNLRTLVSSIRMKRLSIIYGRTQGFSPFCY